MFRTGAAIIATFFLACMVSKVALGVTCRLSARRALRHSVA